MRRFSIRTLMAFVLISAVGLAALRNANELWARVMMMVAVALIGVAALWAILLRDRERAWWLGFAILGATYLLVSLTPLRYRLGTTHILEYVHAKVADSPIATVEISRFDENSILYRIVTTDGDISETSVAINVYYATPAEDLLVSIGPANRWRSLLPGAANVDAFQRVGQALFALLAGVVGGTAGVWFLGRRERAGADAA